MSIAWRLLPGQLLLLLLTLRTVPNSHKQLAKLDFLRHAISVLGWCFLELVFKGSFACRLFLPENLMFECKTHPQPHENVTPQSGHLEP